MGIEKRTWNLGKLLSLNPVVCFWTLGWLWAFIIWLYVKPEDSMTEWWWYKRRIEYAFIWLYYCTRNVWILFLVWLYFSKYANFVLGKNNQDTKTDYSDISWIVMMFSAGMGIALHYFGVSEPVFHLNQSLQHAERAQSFFSANTASQEGIFLTFFNFGFHGWAPFVLVCVALGWAHYRKELPFAFRSIFYPIIGDRIYGWLGDVADFLACMTAFFGISTMTGLCVIMFCNGMNWMSWWLPYTGLWDQKIQNTDVMTIVLFITSFVGVISILVGLNYGARRFTEIAVMFSIFVPLMIFLMDDTWYQFNLITEMVGYYFFYFFKIAHHVDAYAKLDQGLDVAVTGRNQLSPWYDGWGGNGFFQPDKAVKDGGYGALGMTGIYWGWWISIAPFVGMWMAKISKGRTIKQILHWGFLFPTLVCFIWIGVMGGLGIKMERRAIHDACVCSCETTSMTSDKFASRFCPTVGLNPTGMDALSMYYEGGPHGGEITNYDNVIQTCELLRPAVRGEPAGCPSIVQPSKRRPEQRWWLLLDEYMTSGYRTGAKNMGRFLSGVTLTALVCWMVTIMDTGSFVLDAMLSNGRPENKLWRILMLFTSLALTIALLRAGARYPMFDSATALQTLSFVIGMLCTLLLTALPVCIYHGLEDSEKNHLDTATRWTQPVGGGIGNIMESVHSLNGYKWPQGETFVSEIIRFLIALLVPYFKLPLAYNRHIKEPAFGPLSRTPFIALFSFTFWWAFVALLIVEGSWYFLRDGSFSGLVNGDEGMWAIAWSGYIAFASIVAACRYSIRQKYGIFGNVVQDFFVSLFFYPMVICQLDRQQVVEPKPVEPKPVEKVAEPQASPEPVTTIPIPIPVISAVQYSPMPAPLMVGGPGFYGPQMPRMGVYGL